MADSRQTPSRNWKGLSAGKAREAYTLLREGKNYGKIVLTIT